MRPVDVYYGMLRVANIGANSLREGRREQLQPAIDQLNALIHAWWERERTLQRVHDEQRARLCTAEFPKSIEGEWRRVDPADVRPQDFV